jgi:hypothetical protein
MRTEQAIWAMWVAGFMVGFACGWFAALTVNGVPIP